MRFKTLLVSGVAGMILLVTGCAGPSDEGNDAAVMLWDVPGDSCAEPSVAKDARSALDLLSEGTENPVLARPGEMALRDREAQTKAWEILSPHELAVQHCLASNLLTGASSEWGDARTATGTLTAVRGQVSGRVEVEVVDVAFDSGEIAPMAIVAFTDLEFPYDYLTLGGSLSPRGDDPCFDTGTNSGGGQMAPDQSGTTTGILPAEAAGFTLHEVLLYLDSSQLDPETDSCMQSVMARAPLTWKE